MSTYGTPHIYSDTTPSQHDWNRAADEGKAVECYNCAWRGHLSDVKDIKHFWERVAPGETMPAGECPECGSLAGLVDHT